MNQKNQKLTHPIKQYFIIVVLGIFVFSVALRLFMLNQMGRTWDEFIYVDEGYKMVELIKKGDFDNQYFVTTYDHPPLLKYFYGLTAHLDAYKALPNNTAILNYDLTYSRLLSAIIFSIGVIFTVFIGWRLFSPIVGIIAGVILAMLPFSLGLSQLVTTESWKIFIYPLAIYSYILVIRKYSVKKVIIAGIITGIALQVKQSDILLLLIFVLMYILYYRQTKKKQNIAFINNTSKALLFIGILSVLTYFLIWPQSLFHYSEIQALDNHYWGVKFSPKPWQITISQPEIFFGKLILTPVFYYWVYFLISIPVIILILFFIGFKRILNSKNWEQSSILLWFAIPLFIMSFYSWRQHGLRYILEIYPAIALIAAVGFDAITGKITQKETKKLLYFLPVVLYLFVILWQIKPYYLDYFNELVGGTNTVYKYRIFQQGWWGQGIRDAGLYVYHNAPEGSTVGLAISPIHVLPKFKNFTYQEWNPQKSYDYVIVNYYHVIRDGFDDSTIRKNYVLVYEVKADKAVLAYVYRKK
jgi:4-amino-4-deoxy-L-arabinose transferase-like glycosyltransferase